MKFFTVLLPFVAVALAAPAKRGTCTNPQVRVEWRSLTQDQRNSFHQAVKCLQTKGSDKGGQTLFDRFSSLHVDMFGDIHYVAAFLPWHRYFSYARQKSLEACGYTGPTTYWDWTRDANKNMEKSEIFDPTKGFGGGGKVTDNNCVQTGPYAKSSFSIGYPEKRCLQRKFNMAETRTWWGSVTGPSTRHSSAVIANINKNQKFVDFWPDLEEGPHDAVHNEVAGDMAASFSPDDPLFFEHHNNIDRYWALWQGRNETRLQDYTGNTVQGQGQGHADGSRFAIANLDSVISLGGLGDTLGLKNVTVRQLMDTQGDLLCYKYDQ